MANIKVGLSKKSTVVLLILFFLVLGGGGGYLLWRVNQAKTVAPTDSSASEEKLECIDYNADCRWNGPYPKDSNGNCPNEGTAGICQYPHQDAYCCRYKKVVDKYHITFNAGPNGSVSPSGQQSVSPGGSISSTATASSGYKLTAWKKGNQVITTNNTLTVNNVQADAIYTATFEALPVETVTLKYTAGTGGTITGKATQTINKGANGETVTAKPDIGYDFERWSDNVEGAVRQDKNVQNNIDVKAIFKKKEYQIAFKVKNNVGGTVSNAGDKVSYGGSISSTAKPEPNKYKFEKWEGSGGGTESDKSKEKLTISSVKNSATYTAVFKKACGDGICDSWENMQNCNADCKGCGDGVCDPAEENAKKCPKDCKAKCGDGFCTHNENAETCPEDCQAKCGDNICSPSEDAQTCPQDCPVNCGDGICSEDENPEKCPADCPSVCGDGMCTGGESSADCPDDCGSPVVGEVVPETGIFDDSRHTMIFGAVVLVVGIAWTWIATLPKKVIHTVSSVSSAISSTNDKLKRKKLTRERDSRRSKLEKRIK